MDESESLTLLRGFFLPLSNSCSFPWICWEQVQYTCFEVSQSGFRVCVGGPRGEFQLNSVETALYLMAYVAACLQEGPAMILLPIVTHWCSPLRTVCRPVWSVGYCRDDGKWLLSWVVTDIATSALCCSESVALAEASCHIGRILKQSYGEVHMVKNWGIVLTASMNLPCMREFWGKRVSHTDTQREGIK